MVRKPHTMKCSAVMVMETKLACIKSKSMRKVDVLSLIFIDFYVPAPTPWLNSTGTSMHVSENISLFGVCRTYTGVVSKET
jgi:hypothetical protein